MVVKMINSVNFQSINSVNKAQVQAKPASSTSSTPTFTANKTMPFGQSNKSDLQIRTKLNNQEHKIYNALLNNIDKTSRKRLETLLKRGILLNSNSQDKSTTLDNLYKIGTTQRAEGLDAKNIIEATIEILENPFKSTQKFGDIPKNYKSKIVNAQMNTTKMNAQEAEASANVKTSGTCPAASIEFDLAQKTPAEFTRFIEALSSPAISVDKTISLDNLADNILDAVWLLNAFEVPYEMNDFNQAKLKLSPDKNALLRAQIQTTDRDGQERSVVDVLLQSTFMNIGSQQTYNSINDKRAGKFNDKDTGLVEFEKTFTESIIQDKNKITLINQIINDKEKLVGYENDLSKLKQQILETLQQGENIIIGYTFVDNKNNLLGGHEITIVGAREDRMGRTYLICNDSDDNHFGAIEYLADELLPKIHHATFPKNIVEKDVKFEPNWVEGLKNYRAMKQDTLK